MAHHPRPPPACPTNWHSLYTIFRDKTTPLLELGPLDWKSRCPLRQNWNMCPYSKSQPLSLRYKSILPTSLTNIILRNQRLLTLETCCGFWYGSDRNSRLNFDAIQQAVLLLKTEELLH